MYHQVIGVQCNYSPSKSKLSNDASLKLRT